MKLEGYEHLGKIADGGGRIMLAMIVARAKHNVIGKDNQLIWHLPKDLQYFKKS